MKQRTKGIFTVMHVICWILFFGLCIKTGAILYSGFVSLYMNPEGAKNLHMGLNLSELYNYSKPHYVILLSMIILITALEAFIFYQIIKVFLKINYVHPFSKEVASLISKIGYVALGVGVLSIAGIIYCDVLAKKGVAFPNLGQYLGTGGEFVVFAGVVFCLAQIFKRGVEIQSENELTV